MNTGHLSEAEVNAYTDGEMDDAVRTRAEEHVAACPMCRGHVASGGRMDDLLRAIPRHPAPRDLPARISAAVELRQAQERMRRERLPLLIAATLFSSVVTLWFGFQMLIAFQENGALDFFSLVTSHPEILSIYSTDALLALLESFPISEIALTLFALLTALVLAQQWRDSAQPNARSYRHGRN